MGKKGLCIPAEFVLVGGIHPIEILYFFLGMARLRSIAFHHFEVKNRLF
jgi:hypothetical protein